MDFATLPPEINSGKMYAGAGSRPMLTAAAAWDGLAAELHSAAASSRSVVSGLTRGPWLGPASTSMMAATAPYLGWLSVAAEQAKQAGAQARSAAVAYEAAFAAAVPPPVIAENRALLTSLVATNILGQNTAAIAATETRYAEMWAQDAAAMYGYASGSAAASRLSPFTPPPQTTNPAGVAAQAAAVGQATATSAAARSAATLSQVVSTVPNLLHTLASGALSVPKTADFLNFSSGLTFVTSGILFILGPALTGPVKAALPAAAALLGASAPATPVLGAATMSAGQGRTAVLAGAGRAASIGGMSVPPAWATEAPEIARSATALPEPALTGLTEAGPDGLGPGYGGMLPGSLLAAAAGGGGAAGGSWAAARGGPAGQTRAGTTHAGAGLAQSGCGPRFRYIPPPTVLPLGARETDPRAGAARGQAMRPAHSGGEGLERPSRDTLRDELDELRKQVADLATEREVLMHSLALWARESTGQ